MVGADLLEAGSKLLEAVHIVWRRDVSFGGRGYPLLEEPSDRRLKQFDLSPEGHELMLLLLLLLFF